MSNSLDSSKWGVIEEYIGGYIGESCRDVLIRASVTGPV